MDEATSCLSLEQFCRSIMEIFGPEYLRSPTIIDIKKLHARHEEKHGFSRMLESLDCDINVIHQSLLLNRLKQVKALEIPFVANAVTYLRMTTGDYDISECMKRQGKMWNEHLVLLRRN
ncbi:hypothetical protein Tco_0525568 [Tanacetum coccineum]